MSVEENLQKVDAIVEAFNPHDWDRFAGLFAESAVLYAPDLPEPLKGRDALRERFQGLEKAFPDLHIEKLRTIGQGDWVCAEFSSTGTHKGPLPGPGGQTIPATNKTTRDPVAVVFKFEGGQITEAHEYRDVLGMMTQLGLAP
ncbi:MAG: ester cyclase [Thermoplasmata archaeon]